MSCALSLGLLQACPDASGSSSAAALRDAGEHPLQPLGSRDTIGSASGANARSGGQGGARAPGAAASPGRSVAAAAAATALDAGARDAAAAQTLGGAAAPEMVATDAATTDTALSEPAPLVFATVEIDEGTSVPQIGNGDLWPSCWSDDDALYTAGGDGNGFGLVFNDIFTARIDGQPGAADFRGTQLAAGASVSDIWSGSKDFTRKPTGMLCLQGDLYLAVQDLSKNFDQAPAATIVRSRDKGRTWSWDRSGPMFSQQLFTTIMFLDYGKDSEHAPGDFVYAYGLDDNWAFSEGKPGPTRMYLARVPKDRVQSRKDWQFFTGRDAGGEPRFSEDIAEREPVLEDTRRVCSKPLDPMLQFQNMTVINQGGVVYDAPLDRYIYTTWTEYTFEFYEAPAPWGPFKLFFSKDFGVWPWDKTQNGGYGTTIASKFISQDGKDMWLQANAWESATGKDNYALSFRALHLEPYQRTRADNTRGDTNLASADVGAVRLTRALRSGHAEVMNDGVTDGNAEDSYNGEAKDQDYWGYTWAGVLHINTVRYTTGEQGAAGGYFEQLAVQMRRGDAWVHVAVKAMSPDYPGDASVAPFTTYTLRFADIETDGLRIFGKPGGSEHYTSIAELSVHFE